MGCSIDVPSTKSPARVGRVANALPESANRRTTPLKNPRRERSFAPLARPLVRVFCNRRPAAAGGRRRLAQPARLSTPARDAEFGPAASPRSTALRFRSRRRARCSGVRTSAANLQNCDRLRIGQKRELLPRAAEEPRQRVIVAGADRVEFVVVAAGTGDAQTKERLAQHVDLVVELVALLDSQIDGRVKRLARTTRTPSPRPTRSCGRGNRGAAEIKSPAMCSVTNWSKGRSSLNARMT